MTLIVSIPVVDCKFKQLDILKQLGQVVVNRFYLQCSHMAVSHLIPKGEFGIGPLAPKDKIDTLLVVL